MREWDCYGLEEERREGSCGLCRCGSRGVGAVFTMSTESGAR